MRELPAYSIRAENGEEKPEPPPSLTPARQFGDTQAENARPSPAASAHVCRPRRARSPVRVQAVITEQDRCAERVRAASELGSGGFAARVRQIGGERIAAPLQGGPGRRSASDARAGRAFLDGGRRARGRAIFAR